MLVLVTRFYRTFKSMVLDRYLRNAGIIDISLEKENIYQGMQLLLI